MHDNYEIHDLAEELMTKYSHYQLARRMVLMEMKVKELEEQLDILPELLLESAANIAVKVTEHGYYSNKQKGYVELIHAEKEEYVRGTTKNASKSS